MNLASLRAKVRNLESIAASRKPIVLGDAPDVVAWAEAAAGIQLDAWQRDIIANSHKRKLLLCSRQTGKSEIAALAGAYKALFSAHASVAVISPTLRQSRNLFERIESAILNTDPCPRIIRHTSTMIRLAHGGTVRALPGDAPDKVRGLTATDIVIDEAAFVREAVLMVVLPMLATTDGAMTMLSTPSGPQGPFYDAWHTSEGWLKTKVLATNCPRISAEFLADARRKLGEMAYRQEYNCEFIQASSTFFSAELIRQAFDQTTGKPGYLDGKRSPSYFNE